MFSIVIIILLIPILNVLIVHVLYIFLYKDHRQRRRA